MKRVIHSLLKILCLLPLLFAGPVIHGAVIRIVAVTYDAQTFVPVPGKQVVITIQQLTPTQTLYQQTLISSSSGEIILPPFTVPDSTQYSYHFSLTDCQNTTLHFTDTLTALQNDTLFLYFGICHTYTPGSCQASFNQMPDSTNPLIYKFFDLSGGNPVSWLWYFGDGTTSTQKNPVKQYTAPGVYFVCLTIHDSLGPCQSTWCSVLSITQGISINAAFTPLLDSFALIPRKVLFFNESQSNVPLNKYVWNFGDGAGAQIKTPVHHYKQSGQFMVCLTTGHAGGLLDTFCTTVMIPDYFNLWGQLFAQNITATGGQVHLIQPKQTLKGYPVLDQAMADGNGLYYFAQRITYNYLLRAIPDPSGPASAGFLPTYSGNTIFWKDAALVNLNTDISNYDLRFQKLKQAGSGIGQVSGVVGSAMGAIPPHTLVLLLDATDRQPVAFTWADTITGTFNLGFLPYGSYILVAEVPGLNSTEEPIELTPQTSAFTGVPLWLSLISHVPQQKPDDGVFSVYPNPVTSLIYLSIPPNQKPQAWIILNAKGERVLHEVMSGLPGQHTISTEMLPAGVYTMVVYTDKQRQQLTFVKI